MLIFLGMLAGLLLLFIFFTTINHKFKLHKEEKQFLPPGEMAKVNGKKLHVFGKGKGTATLVFMSGHGTSSPSIDFKPLWQRLLNNCRVAVVERPGYGWSEAAKKPRDIDTMLEETRRALLLAGENPPYVLLPHSMSGLEALYWAQKYPCEVQAITGLDPLVPEVVEKSLKLPPKTRLLFMYLISRLGLSRFMPDADAEKMFPLLQSDQLSAEDKKQYMAMVYKSAYTKNMLHEIDCLLKNAQRVKAAGPPPETPTYFFISEGSDIDAPGWREMLTDYVLKTKSGKYRHLNCGHYLHHFQAELIAKEITGFIQDLKLKQ